MKLFPEQEPTTEASTYERTRRTGFVENWSNALGLAIAEDLPVTSRMISTTVESQRNQKIREHINDGSIPLGIHQFYEGDPDGLAGYARDVLGLEDIPTDQEYQEQRLQEYASYREMSEDVSARQTKMGFVGEMAGYAHAMALDPVYAVSFLTGYGTATTIGQAALRVGASEAAIETTAQLWKVPWKEEIGADYGAAQALTEIAFAGLGAAGLAALGKGVEGAITKRFTAKDLTVEQGVEVIEKLAKDNPELEPVLNTLKHADPEENMLKVVEADETIDIQKANEGAKLDSDPRGDLDLDVGAIETVEEEIFLKRQPKAIEVTDRVSLVKPTTEEKIRGFKEEERLARKAVKSATKKAQKAQNALANAEANPSLDLETAAGKKARQAVEREKLRVEQTQQALEEANQKLEQSTALTKEAVETAEKEGVPRGTPEVEPDIRHPMVKEADDMVVELDAQLKTLEDCF